MAERSRADAEAQRWTQRDELMALNAELVHAVYRAILGTTGNKPPKPLRITRPGQEKSEQTAIKSHREMFAFIKEE